MELSCRLLLLLRPTAILKAMKAIGGASVQPGPANANKTV
jgi:hypothetical protein